MTTYIARVRFETMTTVIVNEERPGCR